jgi:hypothetical protein
MRQAAPAAPIQTRYVSCADTAKLVRQALAKAFPGVRFSVRSKTYSGGASIDVRWTDGPAPARVDAVVQAYRGADFDASQDLKVYRNNVALEDGKPVRVRYCADFIFTQRNYSRRMMERVGRAMAEKWGCAVPEIREEKDGSAYFAEDFYVPNACDWFIALAHRERHAQNGPIPGRKKAGAR